MFSYLQNVIVSVFACYAYVFLFIECDNVIVCLLFLWFLIYRMGQCHCLLVMLMFSYLQNVIVSLFACYAYVFLFMEWDSVIVCLLCLCFLIYRMGQCHCLLVMLMFSYLQNGIVSLFGCYAYVFLFMEWDSVIVCLLCLCFLIYRMGQCHCLLVMLMFSYLQNGIVSLFACYAYVFLFIEWDSVTVCLLCLCFLIYRM